MKNLIYQYYVGNLVQGQRACIKNMKEYADRIGAEHRFEHNPKWVTNLNLGKRTHYFGTFKPIYDESFHQYDNVLYTDIDIFAKDGLNENIFEGFNHDIGYCEETFQPKYRVEHPSSQFSHTMDEKWAKLIENKWNVKLPRNDEGLLKVYNAGLVLFSNKGMMKAKERWIPFRKYMDIVKQAGNIHEVYTSDQNYLHAMLNVMDMDWCELDTDWNCFVHYLGKGGQKNRPVNDMRTANTKFVHIMITATDHLDEQSLWRITNLPVKEWRLK